MPNLKVRLLPAIALWLTGACTPIQERPAQPEVERQQQKIELCDSTRQELTTSADARFLSTGMISNGCTGFLIDAEHVVAAAHCFTNQPSGGFQLVSPLAPSNRIWLKFYPNFHPDRVQGSPAKVPRGDIDRVVAGSRVARNPLGRTPLFPNSDWAIAHISQWYDVDPADLSFAQLDGTLVNSTVINPAWPDKDIAPERGPIENPAYVRSALDGHPDLIWDNVTCGDADGNGTVGMWQLARRLEPTGEMTGCNQRWMAGSIFSDCELVTVRDDVVRHDCETWGGSSGSPFIREKNGQFSVIGVGHGYGSPMVPVQMPGKCTVDADCGPVAQRYFCAYGSCRQWYGNDQMHLAAPRCIANDHHIDNLNAGASASRFVDAPRYAENVAVARRPDGDSATAVFAVDSDLNKVVYRERKGLTYESDFTFWRPMPPVGANEAKLSRIAACSDENGHPMVFVVARQLGSQASLLFRSRFDPAQADFTPWQSVQLQDLDSSLPEELMDIDAAYDDKSNCLLFALDRGEKTISFADMTRSNWSSPAVSWEMINDSPDPAEGERLTALRNEDGSLWVVTLDAAGQIWALAEECHGSSNKWFTYPRVPNQQGVSAWLDVDAYWNKRGNGRLVALPRSHDIEALVQFELPPRVCGQWDVNGVPAQPQKDVPINTTLWTPGFMINGVPATSRRPFLTSITASRWLEDKPGDVSPLIMGTDDFGNVYFISNTVGYGWNRMWQSFNHEEIYFP